jgi:uncharacterized protein with GYD domain
MATYVSLCKYTAQGLQNIKGAPKRTEDAIKAAAAIGVKIRETLWLQGEYDLLVIAEASDETAMTAFTLNVLKQGNLHTHTTHAFTIDEMKKILEKVS